MTTWSEYPKPKNYPALRGSRDTEVAVVGGGLSGIMCAYELAKAGKEVVLLEKAELLSGASMATTAFITKVIDTDLSEMISIYGKDQAKKIYESGQKAIDKIEKIAEAENIDCEFTRCPNYIYASTKKQAEGLLPELEAFEELGIEAHGGDAGDLIAYPHYGFIKVPDQAKFHLSKFAYALAEKAREEGAEIFERTAVSGLEEKDGKIFLETSGGAVRADSVIIATYKPLTQKKTHLKKGMYFSFILEAQVPKDSFPEAIYEDLSNPYYYFRIDPGEDYDRMILGGADYKAIFGTPKALTKKSFQAVEKYLKKIMQNRPYVITKRWYGPILEPSDGLALIGEIKPGVYVATAFSGNGMTYSAISAMLLSDLILGKKNPWTEVYDPKRPLLQPKRLAAKARDYTAEFLQGVLKNMLAK